MSTPFQEHLARLKAGANLPNLVEQAYAALSEVGVLLQLVEEDECGLRWHPMGVAGGCPQVLTTPVDLRAAVAAEMRGHLQQSDDVLTLALRIAAFRAAQRKALYVAQVRAREVAKL